MRLVGDDDDVRTLGQDRVRDLPAVGAQAELLDRREDHLAAARGEQVAQLLYAVGVLDLAHERAHGDELIKELVVEVGAIHLDDERRVLQLRTAAQQADEESHG